MVKLGVNIDHFATLRQARRTAYPDPVEAALAAIRAGADAITVHLREDRRHIQDDDLVRLRSALKSHLNQELAPVTEMVEIAARIRPNEVCFVPERREELTTEGGLDVVRLGSRLESMIKQLKQVKAKVSLFVEPQVDQIEAAAKLDVDSVELHTGTYSNYADQDALGAKVGGLRIKYSVLTRTELDKLIAAAKLARSLGLKVNAGHGLNYHNVGPIAEISGLNYLHIGHSIVARATLVGIARAVREMKRLIHRFAARPQLARSVR
jgi:pyridoxine 5-phosphate synthase